MIRFRILLLLVFSFVFLSLSGCETTKSPYDHPPEWFQPELQQELCPDLAGTYDNMSIVDFEHLNSYSLFGTLFPSLSAPSYPDCYDCTIDIRWLDDKKNTLSVTLADFTGKSKTRTRTWQLKKSSGDFRCENGALIIDYKNVVELLLIGGYMSGTNRFYKGSDGTAMCEKNYSSFYHGIYYPYFMSAKDQTNFLRWKQHASTPLKLLTPDEKLAVIVSYVEKSLASDMLQESSRSEPNEFVNILNQCGDMLSRGNITGVCEILNKAYKLSDGLESPPDLIEGQVREGISDQILFLMVSLKCQREIPQE